MSDRGGEPAVDAGAVPAPPIVNRELLLRRFVAGALGVAGFAPTVARYGDDNVSVWVPLLVLVGGAFAIHRQSLGAQLLGRATWWANLLLGLLLASEARGYKTMHGTWLVLACAAALLLVSTEGLAEARARDGYAPAAFTTTLTLAMMLALADTLSLVLFTVVQLEDGESQAALLALGAAAMIVSFIGLYRIKPWGMIANLVTNLVVAGVAAVDGFGLDDEVNALLMITACLQLIVATPVLIGVLRGQPLPPLVGPRWRKRLTQGGLSLVAATAALSLVMTYLWTAR